MKEFNFKKIDAFATESSTGNPAGYIRLAELADITTAEMQQIAKELKGFVNEVGYLAQVNDFEFDLRYYSSEREVDFCGHATIAIMYDLIQTNKFLAEVPTLKINTNRGSLTVYNQTKSEDAVFIMSPVPEHKKILIDSAELEKQLKLTLGEVDTQRPISVINAGLTTLIVPIVSLEAIIKIKPDMEELKRFCVKSQIDIIEVYTTETRNKRNDYRTRVFAPTFGYLEDPATGSGNSAFGYYLIENDWWTEGLLTIEQNGLIDNYNVVKLQMQKDESNGIRVCFGGNAVTRIEGKYYIYK